VNSTPLVCLAVFASALVIEPASAQPEGEGRNVDERAIQAVLAAYGEAWNRHDMQAWGRLFTDDVDYVNRAGGIWRGNAANVEGHTAIHAALKKQHQKMTWSATAERISFLSPDIALVHAAWKWPGFVLPSGAEAEDFHGMMTLVMVKQRAQWLIRALHNTVATPEHPDGR
jgi:uncharacterized protein (TIGR02246 family)